MITIRNYQENDWAQVWPILESVFRAGDTYAFSPDITETQAHQTWINAPQATFIALDSDQRILGTYYIKPNQPELGAHICNCGYIVSESARGQGIATQMCEHSQQVAVELGFRAMQYNLVVATNTGAIRLWKKLGFAEIGRVPEAFRHPQLGYVDALILYKALHVSE